MKPVSTMQQMFTDSVARVCSEHILPCPRRSSFLRHSGKCVQYRNLAKISCCHGCRQVCMLHILPRSGHLLCVFCNVSRNHTGNGQSPARDDRGLTLTGSFHTFMSHSAKAFAVGMKLDFQGIILLMWGANIPLIYYGLICSVRLQIAYWTLTTVLAACCSIFTFQPKFSEPHLRPLRAATFGSLALSTFIPVIHGIIVYGYPVQNQRVALQWVLATLVFNTLGATAYAFKV